MFRGWKRQALMAKKAADKAEAAKKLCTQDYIAVAKEHDKARAALELVARARDQLAAELKRQRAQRVEELETEWTAQELDLIRANGQLKIETARADRAETELARVTEQRDRAWRGVVGARTALNCIGYGLIGEYHKVCDVGYGDSEEFRTEVEGP